ncbi:MAG TPA: thioredoxin family protein [Kofleriaceae bacterium]
MKAWIALAAVVACSKAKPPPPPPPPPAPASNPCAKAVPEGPLAWIADDYPDALACARDKKLPVVVDLWAPWCHTCLSMQTTVFRDPSFTADRDRFVFLALDTDREANAPALAKLSISAWPTFYVIDSSSEQVLARFIGAAGIAQFHGFLDAGARALTGGGAAADARMLGADRAMAKQDYQTAADELAAALGAADAAWPRRAEAIYDRGFALVKSEQWRACADLADARGADMGTDALATNFWQGAWFCASKLDDAARKTALQDRAIARWRAILADPHAQLSIDDRAEAMGYLRDALDERGDKDGALAVAEQARVLVDDAAAKAPDPRAAMTYNWPRAEVYVYLGRPLELVPALEKSARDLPGEYDPRARLGWVYWKAGKLPEAAKWTDEALAMVYGPRKGRLLVQRAEIAAAAGDHAGERTFREQAVKLYESLPEAQQSPGALAAAKAALAKLN